MHDQGLIGNCQALALVDRLGSIGWMCWPRPDSPPVFGRLLDPDGGDFAVDPVGLVLSTRQRYLPNTNVIETELTCADGTFTITDLLPRFAQHGRMYRPLTLVRTIRRVSGTPRVIVRCRPVVGWSKEPARIQRGNSHLRFLGFDDDLRLTTTIPLTHLLDQQPVALTGSHHCILSWGVPPEGDVARISEEFLIRTVEEWRHWVRQTTIPVRYQTEVIRSALVLKLHCFEETGAVLAAATTSLPEQPGGTRNWDYRYCWLRDAFFTVAALYRIGHTSELEGILRFLLGIMQADPSGRLGPVFRLDGTLPLPEIEHPNWAGHAGGRPVRSGNQAAEHVQNDVYGEMLLVLAALYQDERFAHLRGPDWERLLVLLAGRCRDTMAEPDAGLWELRGGWKPHAFSTLMCRTGLNRFAHLVEGGLGLIDPGPWRAAVAAADIQLTASIRDGILRNAPGEDALDASLALLTQLHHPDRELAKRTVQAITERLACRDQQGQPTGFFYRYRYSDDFGTPERAFVICSFWIAEALALQGDAEAAERVLGQSLTAANHLGLFAEHFDPAARQQTGNFPQCYSHVGLIHAAFAVSPAWPSVLA